MTFCHCLFTLMSSKSSHLYNYSTLYNRDCITAAVLNRKVINDADLCVCKSKFSCKAAQIRDSIFVTPNLYDGRFFKDSLITIYLKPLRIMHYKSSSVALYMLCNAPYNALYNFMNNCYHS